MHRENSSVPSQLRTWGDSATRRLFHLTKLNGGSTVSLETGKAPAKTDGYFVGSAPGWDGKRIETVIIPVSDFRLEGVGGLRQTFAKMYADHLAAVQISESVPVYGGYIGTFVSDGLVYVDAVTWCESRAEAVRLGMERGEMAIFDIAANGSLMLESLRSEYAAGTVAA
jgi:hypothetical protein